MASDLLGMGWDGISIWGGLVIGFAKVLIRMPFSKM